MQSRVRPSFGDAWTLPSKVTAFQDSSPGQGAGQPAGRPAPRGLAHRLSAAPRQPVDALIERAYVPHVTTTGLYADGRTYPLPPGWNPVGKPVLETALGAATEALDETAFDRVRTYYDPASKYAGNFLTAEDGYSGGVGPQDIDPSDLFAVGTLSIAISPLAARRLLRPSPARSSVRRSLAGVPGGLPITALDSEPNSDGRVLESLKSAYDAIRTSSGENSNMWVFAAKLLARKRPYLAPVRDNLVCVLLNGGSPLRRPGVGTFVTDLQVFAYLMTSTAVTTRLDEIRRVLDQQGGDGQLEPSDLRLLDVVLWTSAVGHWK